MRSDAVGEWLASRAPTLEDNPMEMSLKHGVTSGVFTVESHQAERLIRHLLHSFKTNLEQQTKSFR